MDAGVGLALAIVFGGWLGAIFGIIALAVLIQAAVAAVTECRNRLAIRRAIAAERQRARIEMVRPS